MTNVTQDDAALAGEYVLGLLDSAVSAQVSARIATDTDFAREVRAWQERLMPLLESEEQIPSTDVWSKIAAQISAMPDIHTDDAFVKAAFQKILSVDANEQEVAASIAAMQEFQSLTAATESDAMVSKPRTMLIQALINHNDFVTIR